VTGISIWIAWRDLKISARLMLWIEAVSGSFIFVCGRTRPGAAWLEKQWTRLSLSLPAGMAGRE
jgi:hypothetical protein